MENLYGFIGFYPIHHLPKFYFLNKIQIRVPTKIPTARAIMIGTMNCPSLMYFVDELFYLVKH